MNIKQKDRGFTLVELIIVIAIIGILAAVLIPTIGGYIEKAHRGRDVELAGNMTRDVSLYATEYDVEIDELTGVDVRTILLFNNYDLVPRRDKWVFVYDKTTNQVVVKDINKGGTISLDPAVPTNPIDPTHIEENYFLISKGKNSIEKAVNLMVNLSTPSDYTSALGLLSIDDKYYAVISKFDPKNTVFLDNGGIFTEATKTDPATRMVVLELTSSLPMISEADYLKMNLAVTQIYPKTIRTSDPKSPLKSLFKEGVKDIDTRKIYKIDLPSFGEGNLGDSIYKFELGDYVVDSFKQTVSDEVIGIIHKTNGGSTVGYIIKRQLTVSYFNKEGLFAQGSIIYAVLEDPIPSS